MKYYTYHDSPVGRLLLAGTRDVLTMISFPKEDRVTVPDESWLCEHHIFAKVITQLDEYFSGSRIAFSVNMELEGTDFQKKVWTVLSKIPFGETISYGEVAHRISQPNASRAVGAANNANPIPIIIPCHRVIGADKSMTGFGGGIKTKIKLLELEFRLSSSDRQQGDLFYQAE